MIGKVALHAKITPASKHSRCQLGMQKTNTSTNTNIKEPSRTKFKHEPKMHGAWIWQQMLLFRGTNLFLYYFILLLIICLKKPHDLTPPVVDGIITQFSFTKFYTKCFLYLLYTLAYNRAGSVHQDAFEASTAR
jgi:hypothetical protein